MRAFSITLFCVTTLYGQGAGGVQFRDWTVPIPTSSPVITCGELRGLTSYDISVISAIVIPGSADVPEHCRVHLMVQPEINIEVNLPAKWNSRLYMFGNGGWAGESFESQSRAANRAHGLKAGFVTAATDTGHSAVGEESQIATSALVQRYPLISPSGLKIAYSVYESDRRALYVSHSGKPAEKVCDGCLRATDWSSRENELLVFGESPYQIKQLSLASHEQTSVLRHEKYSLLYGRFSPDTRWISFTVRMRPDLAKIAIAPATGVKPIPESSWITIAEVGLDDFANWSPDGRTLYFTSPKDGNTCLWGQHIDSETGQPSGASFAIQHFHGRITFGHGGWSMADRRLGFALVETASNVWTMSH